MKLLRSRDEFVVHVHEHFGMFTPGDYPDRYPCFLAHATPPRLGDDWRFFFVYLDDLAGQMREAGWTVEEPRLEPKTYSLACPVVLADKRLRARSLDESFYVSPPNLPPPPERP